MKNESGRMGTRLLIFIVVVALFVWWLYSWLPTQFRGLTLRDHLKNLASYAGQYPFTMDDVMADSMAMASKNAGVPELTKDYFLQHNQRSGGTYLVKTHYERNPMLLGTNVSVPFKGHLVFDWDIQERYAGP